MILYVCHQILVSNDKGTHKNDAGDHKKLQKLIPNIYESSIIDNASHEPDKVISYCSDYILTKSDKLLLIKDLNFAMLPKKTENQKIKIFKLPASV